MNTLIKIAKKLSPEQVASATGLDADEVKSFKRDLPEFYRDMEGGIRGEDQKALAAPEAYKSEKRLTGGALGGALGTTAGATLGGIGGHFLEDETDLDTTAIGTAVGGAGGLLAGVGTGKNIANRKAKKRILEAKQRR